MHHQRNDAGAIDTRIARDGDITLNPPGIMVSVAALLETVIGRRHGRAR